MNPELLYLIKVNTALVGFYSFYWLFLRKNTFFIWNRYYFLLAVPLFFLFPLINLSGLFSSAQVQTIQQIAPHFPIDVSGVEKGVTIQDGILVLIVVVAGILLVRLGIQLVSLWEVHSKSACSQTYKNCHVMKMHSVTNPFSFLRTIYVNPELHSEEDMKTILEHEQIHVKQCHTIDIMLFETICALCWYNPFVWLIRQAVKQNIEFYTDKKILEAGYDRRQYQHELLKVSQIPVFLKIANNFNFNHLKKRITMMNKKNSSRVQLLKFALAIPLFAGMTLLANNPVSLTEQGSAMPISVQENATITVSKMTHDFGTIKESAQTASTIFILTNNGKDPLVINRVHASCGCTTPEWTKEPIAAGKQGYVKATYNAVGHPGPFDKTVTVETNGVPASIELHIKGTVEKDD